MFRFRNVQKASLVKIEVLYMDVLKNTCLHKGTFPNAQQSEQIYQHQLVNEHHSVNPCLICVCVCVCVFVCASVCASVCECVCAFAYKGPLKAL